MSTGPENEFDLEKLFLPAWAQGPSTAKQYSHYEGTEERSFEGRPSRPGRPPRKRTEPPGPRRDERGPREGRGLAPRGKAPREGSNRRERPDDGPRQQQRTRREHREPPPPLPDIQLSLVPDEKGVESLARQIKMTGRAYPLFDIAQMILQKPERHAIVFSVEKNAEGKPIQPLFVCALDDTLWLSLDETVAHVLKKHFNTFYQAERTATEPPKGRYTFVAQCGMSGVILGPPNYHDYQNQLRKLHSERFNRIPFDVFKSRVKIVRDEEVVKKWIEDQSFKTEYLCLNMPEPLRLGSMEAVEKHFRETHSENIIKSVETHTLSGTAARSLRSPQLVRLVRQVWDDQRRFPLQIATVLSQQFASHGLQFFKVNKTITHVSVARPHYLDLEATPVSEGIRRIVDHINANPKCTRRKLLEALAPVAVTTAAAETPVQPASEPAEPTMEQSAVIADLHWLIHQGHVIEFANGTLETAKKPAPRPPKPEAKKPDETSGATAPVEPVGTENSDVASEQATSHAESSPEAAQKSDAPTASETEGDTLPASPAEKPAQEFQHIGEAPPPVDPVPAHQSAEVPVHTETSFAQPE